MDDFSWSGTDSLVIPRTDAVAVYENTDGDIVIRQQALDAGDDDCVIVQRRNVRDLIVALENMLA